MCVFSAEKELEESVMDVQVIANNIVSKITDVVAQQSAASKDEMHSYFTELLTLSLIWHAYYDAIKEGDGDRVIDMWKFLLIIFKRTGRKNYSKEALQLLVNYNFLY